MTSMLNLNNVDLKCYSCFEVLKVFGETLDNKALFLLMASYSHFFLTWSSKDPSYVSKSDFFTQE